MTYCTYLLVHPQCKDLFKRPVFVCFGSRTNLESITPDKLGNRKQTPSVKISLLICTSLQTVRLELEKTTDSCAEKKGGDFQHCSAATKMRVCVLMELMASVCKQDKSVSDFTAPLNFLQNACSHTYCINSCVINWQMGGIVIFLNLVMTSSPGLFCV